MSKTLMWADTHGPKSFEECDLDILSENDQALLRLVESTRESPNMLFYGPPGTGKTTIIDLLKSLGDTSSNVQSTEAKEE